MVDFFSSDIVQNVLLFGIFLALCAIYDDMTPEEEDEI